MSSQAKESRLELLQTARGGNNQKIQIKKMLKILYDHWISVLIILADSVKLLIRSI